MHGQEPPELTRYEAVNADGMAGGAEFDGLNRRHRYLLERSWNEDRPVGVFVMFNPSADDERGSDRTVTRCFGFARNWGWGRLRILNLFTLMSPRAADVRRDRF